MPREPGGIEIPGVWDGIADMSRTWHDMTILRIEGG